MIGRALADALSARGERVTVTTRRSDQPGAPAHERIDLDLLDVARKGVADLPDHDVAFLCAAVTGFAESRSEPDISDLINVTANGVLAKEVTARGGRTVFLSTSAVYDGHVPLRDAAEMPDGTTLYGRQKAEAEQALAAIDPRLVVIRLAKVFDPGHALIGGWIRDLKAGHVITPFDDLVTAPVPIKMTVDLMCALAGSTERGVFQLSAARDATYAEIARHIAHRLGVPPEQVAPGSAREAGIEPGAVPRHATLDSQRSLMLLNSPPIDPCRLSTACSNQHCGYETADPTHDISQ